MKKLFVTIFVLLSVGSAVAYSAYYSAQAEPAVVTSKYEVGPPDPQEMLELVNIERAKVGAPALSLSTSMTKTSQLKADDFVVKDYYSHTIPGTDSNMTAEMAQIVSTTCSAAGENIANNLTTSKYAVDEWMKSKSHKEAILDVSFNETGFGVSQADNGYYFAVQHFCLTR